LGQADEHPFVRDGAQPVRIELKDAELAARRLDLEVAVDRGTSGYAYPLPTDAPEAFLADGFAGWGEPLNRTNSPAYADVAAVPSATVEISAGGQSVERVRWGDLLERGRVETARARIELIVPARNWVETVVLDDATGQPVPCRVHFRSPEGVPYQPHGHHVHVLSTQGGHREAQGEDLNVVNLLLSQWGSLFTNTEEFTGEPTVSQNGRTIVWATQENRQHLLGHLTLLGLRRPVYPWCSDG